MRGFVSEEEFERELVGLSGLPRSKLLHRWLGTVREQPPKGISTPLLRRALAYELQVRRWRGLRSDAARQLRGAGRHEGAPVVQSQGGNQLQAGDRLMRDWNGKAHVDQVTTANSARARELIRGRYPGAKITLVRQVD